MVIYFGISKTWHDLSTDRRYSDRKHWKSPF